MKGVFMDISLNLLSAGIIISAAASIFFYWSSANKKWFKAAYLTATFNGCLLSWINWTLAARGRVPEISLSGIEWTSETSATNFFSVLCVWMSISGLRGLKRLRDKAK